MLDCGTTTRLRCSVHARLWGYYQIEAFSACSTVGLPPDAPISLGHFNLELKWWLSVHTAGQPIECSGTTDENRASTEHKSICTVL